MRSLERRIFRLESRRDVTGNQLGHSAKLAVDGIASIFSRRHDRVDYRDEQWTGSIARAE